VINLLVPQVYLFRESFDYYYLLGMSCLYTGDYAGAYSYLRRALDLDRRPDAMLGFAAALLRRRQTDVALRTYLDILDIDPHNRRAQRALRMLRNIENPEEAVEWFEDRRIRRILPPIGVYVPRAVIAVGVVAVVVAGALAVRPFVGRLVDPVMETLFAPARREGMELLTRDAEQTPLTTSETARFMLNEREADRLFRRIGDYFNARRDNLVRRELNRIAQSNAHPRMKARAELIRDYLEVPDFTSMKDNFSFNEVIDDPRLYAGVYVRWRGRAANISVGEELIRFDLLVGYHDRRVLSGVVPVVVDFAVLLEDDQPVEVIARVEQSGEQDIRLHATSLRRLSPSEVESQ
jgi:hypothetical protein